MPGDNCHRANGLLRASSKVHMGEKQCERGRTRINRFHDGYTDEGSQFTLLYPNILPLEGEDPSRTMITKLRLASEARRRIGDMNFLVGECKEVWFYRLLGSTCRYGLLMLL